VKSKVCNKCGVEKHLHDFYKQKGSLLGRQAVCKDCKRSYQRSQYYRDRESAKERVKSRYQRVKNTASYRLYKAAKGAKRRCSEINATPSWLNQEQMQSIKDFYWLSKDLQSITGETYHVDHIVPLKGKNVCGLHVPWNLQVLPADINLSKGNRYANDA
jgi:hypothetical protein